MANRDEGDAVFEPPPSLMEAAEEAALAVLPGCASRHEDSAAAANAAWEIAERFVLDARKAFRLRFMQIYGHDPNKVIFVDPELVWTPGPEAEEQKVDV